MTGPFRLVLFRLDELLALHGGQLHARGGRHLAAVEVETLWVLTIGHLQAAEHRHVLDAHLVDGLPAHLDVKRLPADDVAATRHDVGRGDAAGRRHAHARVVRPDGIERPQA